MYPYLKAEMAKRGITALMLSEMTGIPYSTLTPKLRGENPMTLGNAEKIKNALGVDIPMEKLFATEIEGL